jgi:DNA-binding SARP family transcriptional activator
MNDKQAIELRIQLLGGFRLSIRDHSVGDEEFRLRKARNLIKLLALAPNHRLHREQVIDWLWPEMDPAKAANNFHQALFTARKVLSACGLPGPEILQLSEEVFSLCPNSSPWIDVEAFGAAAARARMNRHPAVYQAALDLYTGELLPEDLYEEWTSEKREALRRMRLSLLLELADLQDASHENDKAMHTLQQVIAIDPLYEEAHAKLMRLFALSGRRSAALAQYETCRRLLDKELGLGPSPDTANLFELIRSGEVRGSPKTDTPVPIPPGPLRKPEMPTWLSPFIGRQALLERIGSVLDDPTCRLLTLVGPGGCGKTRLAVEAAGKQNVLFPDGAFFVPLAPLESPLSIYATIAKSLGLDFSEGSATEQQGSDLRSNWSGNPENGSDSCHRGSARSEARLLWRP